MLSNPIDARQNNHRVEGCRRLQNIGLSLESIITGGFIIGFALLVAVSVVSYMSIAAFRDAANLHRHSEDRYSEDDAAVVREGARAVAVIGLGDVLALLLVGATTLTARRELAARHRAENRRADLLAMVTHDIRNPLGVIVGYIELLQGNPTLDADARDLIAGMRTSAETMLSLVRNHLDVSKIEAGHLTLTKQPVNVAALLQQVAESFHVLAFPHKVRIEQRIDPAMPDVNGDPIALERVFANLIGNALKFSPDGATVTVIGEVRGSNVVVKIADQGPGIPPEDVCSLFQRYHQTAAGRLKKGGSGMGLFIVRSLVEAQSGSVRVESEVGRGSCFEVTLPTVEPLADNSGLRAANRRKPLLDRSDRFSSFAS